MASKYLRGKTWWVKFYEHGKEIRRSLKTKDAATAKFLTNEIENRLMKGGSPLPDTSQPTRKLVNEYIAECERRIKPKTTTLYRAHLTAFFEAHGWAHPSRITEKMMTDFLSTLKGKSGAAKPKTANHYLKDMKQFFAFCVRRGYIASNPVQLVKTTKLGKKAPQFLTRPQIHAILRASAKEDLGPAIATAIYTGMRKSEIQRLTWVDVDFRRGRVMVGESKSKTFRVLPLHPALKKILWPLRGKGVCFSFVNFRRVWKRVKRKIEMPGLRFHELRHTFASQMVMSGVDISTVSKLLGHADITTTQIYAHLAQDHVMDSIKKLRI